MNLVSERGDRRHLLAPASVLLALACLALLAIAGRAQAAETIYWDNYDAEPESIAFADITGSGGGALNLGTTPVTEPEGMAFDSATGRLYIAASGNTPSGNGEIVYVNVDGSGAGVLSTPGAEVNEPFGVAIDPATRIIYWANEDGGVENNGSIGFARLDGSGGGLLNTTGVTVDDPYKLAIDPVSGRVFWGNTGTTPDSIGFANLNNSGGGGTLPLAGASIPTGIHALAVDSAAGRVYWLDSGNKRISFASVNGGGGGDIDLSPGTISNAYGMAIDPLAARIYWANYGLGETRTNAIAFVGLNGGGFGGITPVTAPLDGPQDPVILKSPSGAGAPTVARSATPPSALSCSQGSWGADFAGGFVYQAPRTFAYQWTLNGAPVAGATAAALETTQPGSYACVVTASNQSGSASQTSAPVTVKAASVRLTTKKKARVKAGGVATFKVKAVNQGDLESKSARVCVKVPKKAKGDLKAKPKCKPLGKVKGGAKDSAKLRIKVGDGASGTYKVTFQIKGSPGQSAKAKIVVAAPKGK